MPEQDEYGHVWWRCPNCGCQFRVWQFFRCARCGVDHCVSCSRGVNLYERLTGRKEGEGWLCVECCDLLGPDGYRLVAPSLYGE